ncbi:MAG: hypothetical protein R2751_18960 [Bacteroidales bacterium]
MGLALEAFQDEDMPAMAAFLAEAVERQNPDDEGVLRPEHSLMTGFIGTAWISKGPSPTMATMPRYRFASKNDTYPLALFHRPGSHTSIWERLNGYTVASASAKQLRELLQPLFLRGRGPMDDRLFPGHPAGRRPASRTFVLQPTPDPTGEMTWADGWYDSMYRRISSRWGGQRQGSVV